MAGYEALYHAWLTVQTSPWAWPCCSSKHTATIVTQTTNSLMSAIASTVRESCSVTVSTRAPTTVLIGTLNNYHMHPTYIPCCMKAVYSRYIAVGNRMIFITTNPPLPSPSSPALLPLPTLPCYKLPSLFKHMGRGAPKTRKLYSCK